RRRHRQALLLACGLAVACASPGGPQDVSWEARTADAELERARAAEVQGDRAHALELGRRSLQHAREAAARGSIGRALLFLGRTEADLAPCLEAIDVFEAIDDRAGLAEAQTVAAELLLELDRPEAALDHLALAEAALEQAELDRPRWARLAARLHHTSAGAQGRLGRADAAESSERQAELALSLLDDGDEVALRIAVQLGLGAGEARRGWPARAMEHYGQALGLARKAGHRVAQVEAYTGIVAALTELRRYADALSHCERALAVAQELDDPQRTRDLGWLGLQLLDQLGDGADPARRRAFEEALLAGD
ncbi:MAG TPA: hypothetical protein VFD43_12880, partial [Planctomycetota bacterium]|nr:hypothetical protein [Planctomycetota bacterium]